MLERVGGVLTLRVEDGHSGWQFIIRHVMITHDKVNAQRLGVSYLLDCLYATVKHNNQFNTFFRCIVQSLDTDTIALIVTVGNIVFNMGIELLQKLVHQSYRRTSINIVVAIDHDTLFTSHSVIQPIDSHVHVVHQERIYQLV